MILSLDKMTKFLFCLYPLLAALPTPYNASPAVEEGEAPSSLLPNSSTTMAAAILTFFSIFLLFSVIESAHKPDGLVLPVAKDRLTSLYVAQIHHTRSQPLVQTPFVLDLNGRFLWVNCDENHNVPTCRSTICARVGNHYCRTCSPTAGLLCHTNACGVLAVNPLTRRAAMSELAQNAIALQSKLGSRLGPLVNIRDFVFTCSPSSLMQGGFPMGAQGVAGMGHGAIAMPSQLASRFGFRNVFATCLSSSGTGVVFFGDGPYKLQPGIDASQNLRRTPLIITREGEYSIQVTSIKINGKTLPLNQTRPLISAVISTASPFTTLQRSLFQSVTQFFSNQLSQVPRVNPIAPFGLCFDSTKISSTRIGPGVPNIDLVLHHRNSVWTFVGANSMVQARPGALCLAFVDGGLNPRSPIVIGGYQLEDNILQFDLHRSFLGFSSSLLGRSTTCANFNFNSTT